MVDELIVVDTGSTDNTVAVAAGVGAKIYHFQWIDDFSAARNYAISKATGDWIIFLDADEYFSPAGLEKLRETLQEVDGIGDAILVKMCDVSEDLKDIFATYANIRIFKNSPDIKYIGAIHELLHKPGHFKIVDCSDIFTVYHLGYNIRLYQEKNKGKRNLTLLKKQLKEQPENGNLHYYLSDQYLALRNWDKAMEHGKLALKYGVKLLGRGAKTYVNIIQAALRKNASLEEAGRYIREGLEKFPDYPDLYVLQADYYRLLGLFKDEADSLEKALQLYQPDNINYLSILSQEMVKSIFNRLGYLNYLMDHIPGCVQNYSRALQVEKQDPQAFRELFRILLSNECTDDLVFFILRHYRCEEELAFVIKHVIALSAIDVFNQLFKMLPSKYQRALELYYNYFNRNYYASFLTSLNYFQETRDDNFALICLISALCMDNPAGVEEIKEKCLNPAIAALAELFLGQRESLGKDSELFYLKILEDLLDLGEYQIFANLHTAKKFFPDCLDKEIGDIFFKRQRWELALEQYREAFKNRSVSPELYLQAAKCLKNLNQIQASMELLLQAIEVFPDYFPNYYLLITICTESGKIDLLKYVVKKALEKFPESLWIKSLVA